MEHTSWASRLAPAPGVRGELVDLFSATLAVRGPRLVPADCSVSDVRAASYREDRRRKRPNNRCRGIVYI
jgi:hypothetical protein